MPSRGAAASTPGRVGAHTREDGLGGLHLGQVHALLQHFALPAQGPPVLVQVAIAQSQQLPQHVVGVLPAHALQQVT